MKSVDPSLLRRLVIDAEKLPGVDTTVAVVRKGVAELSPLLDATADGAHASTPPTHNDPPGDACSLTAGSPKEGGAELRPAEVYGGDLPFHGAPRTLQEALRTAASEPTEKGTLYLRADGSESFQSYRALLSDAQRLLTGLRATGTRPGASVLFQIKDNRNFVTAFWACVLGGYLPTPVATAPQYTEDNAVTRKLRNAWELLDHPLILTDSALHGPGLHGLAALWDVPAVPTATVEELSANREATDWHPAGPDDPALHLLTSGSTGTPKCVRHHHRSIVSRSLSVAAAAGFEADGVSLNWMPLDHVGGIVMYNVRDVILRRHHVNAETEAFLADPLRWLDWAHRYHATDTWAPNFAFALVNDLAERIEQGAWDLSRLRHVCNAGEAVVPRTAHRFLRLLRPHGLPDDAVRPCWGMSETSSGITYSALSALDERLGTSRVHKSSLSGGRIQYVAEDDADNVTFAEVGPPVPGVRLRITGPGGEVLPEQHVGQLQVSGATLMAGYYNNDTANREAFTDDGWFDTGDLAFLDEGRLTITGRQKDVVIIRGANHLTYDIESVVELVQGVRTTFAAAGGLTLPGSDTEQLAVFFVPTTDSVPEVRRTIDAVRSSLASELGLHADVVVPVDQQQFPKTNSGKIQRAQLLKALAEGRFDDRRALFDQTPEAPADRLFDRVWRPDESAPGSATSSNGVWLLCTNDPVPEQAVRQEAAATGTTVVTASFGDTLDLTPGSYTLDPTDPQHYTELVRTVTEQEGRVTAVLHAGECGPLSPAAAETPETGVLSVLAALQGLTGDETRDAPALLVLTTGAVWTGPGDRTEPTRAALPGLLRTAQAEEALPMIRQVDLTADAPSGWGPVVRAELTRREPTPVVAYRNAIRLLPRLRTVSPDETIAEPFRSGGTYLVTGGLGGIGVLVCEYLLAAYGARLLLVGRSSVDEADTGEKAARLSGLAALGEVEYRVADVADADALRSAADHAEELWGAPLAGVLHLAGADLDDHWQHLEEHTLAVERPETFRAMYHAKVRGTLALADILQDRPNTHLILFSSVNAEFGGRSFGAYAAANSFLNGFADHWRHERGRRVQALSWSMWPGIGMNQATTSTAAESRGFLPVTEESGLAALADALSLDTPNVLIGLDPGNVHIVASLVSDQLSPLEVVLAYTSSAEIGERAVRMAVEEVAAGVPVPVRCVRLERIPLHSSGQVDEQRVLAMSSLPPARRRFTEPAEGLEKQLAGMWSAVLGVSRVGRDDSFFEIGGNSLRAVQLVSRIATELRKDVAVQQLYEHPTVGRLAEALVTSES